MLPGNPNLRQKRQTEKSKKMAPDSKKPKIKISRGEILKSKPIDSPRLTRSIMARDKLSGRTENLKQITWNMAGTLLFAVSEKNI